MIIIFFFLISLLASIIGAISGIGGGIIIKPVFDATHTMSVATVNFLSGCTVLAMTTSSLIRNQKGDIPVNLRMSTMLGIGAAVGGYLGSLLFDLLLRESGNENVVGLIQAIVLLLITVGIYLYFDNRNAIKSHKIDNLLVSLGVGLLLGIISAFLGIGGGPLNLAVLYYLFSMRAKVAALNSIYIIFISQLASLISTLASGNIPPYDPKVLTVMIMGGVLGALIGWSINKRLSNQRVELIFRYLLITIALVNVYNIFYFFQGMSG